jgi:hypothetical protein
MVDTIVYLVIVREPYVLAVDKQSISCNSVSMAVLVLKIEIPPILSMGNDLCRCGIGGDGR